MCGVCSAGCGALRGELEAGRLKVVDAVEAAGGVAYVDFGEPQWFENFNTPEEFGRVAVELGGFVLEYRRAELSVDSGLVDS